MSRIFWIVLLVIGQTADFNSSKHIARSRIEKRGT